MLGFNWLHPFWSGIPWLVHTHQHSKGVRHTVSQKLSLFSNTENAPHNYNKYQDISCRYQGCFGLFLIKISYFQKQCSDNIPLQHFLTSFLRCCLAPHFTLIVLILGVELTEDEEIQDNLLIHKVIFSQTIFLFPPSASNRCTVCL